MNRRRVLLIVAAAVAALGTLLVFLYVRGADARAGQQYEAVNVLTAVDTIPTGETIEAAQAAGKIALTPIPRKSLLEGATTTTEGMTGKVALTPIYAGEQIIPAKFGDASAADTGLNIPDDDFAISVNLSDTSRVSGFVNPGAEVAIFQNGSDIRSGEQYSRLLLPKVTVLAVGTTTVVSTTTTDASGTQTTEQLPRTLMTLATTQEEAQKVMLASKTGELAFALLNEKTVAKYIPPTTSKTLFRR